jgi:hypothetical protein
MAMCYWSIMDSKQSDRFTQQEIQKRMEAALRNKRIAGHKGRENLTPRGSKGQSAGISKPAMKKG